MKLNIKTLSLVVAAGLAGQVNAETEALLYNNQLELNGLNSQSGYELRLRLPEGQLKTLYLAPSESITFEAADFAINQFSDGIYKYELAPLSNQLNKSRNKATVQQAAGQSVSGSFTVVNGSTIVDVDETTRDQVILDDLIVDGSICVGMDCVNGESFGFDTIRLKENNLRIRFFDTSNSASFPSNDWEITVNDSSNGGANKFSITDIDGSRVPFTIEAGARNNALYVDDGGRVGVGTSTPVVETHIVDGDSPTVRLEQNGSNGWSPQTWDLAGNETNFFVRDVTNGSKLPFRIRPDAPTNSIYVDTNGNVGMGTASPDSPIHIVRSNETASFHVQETNAAQLPRSLFRLSNNGNPEFVLENTGTNNTWTISAGNNFVIKNNAGETIFRLSPDGDLTIKGTLTEEGL